MAEEKNENKNTKTKKSFKIPGKEAVSELLNRFKKKKQDPSSEPDGEATSKPAQKKKFVNSKLIVLVLLLGCITASGFVVYKFYFQNKGSASKFKLVKLEHVKLPDEILEFSFYNFPDIYSSLIDYNKQILKIDRELMRIKDIALKYPDHKKIPDKEKKIWDKIRASLIKSFDKIEAAIKEIFVLYSVDEEQGLEKIKEKREELFSKADETLKPVKELTKKFPADEQKSESSFMGILNKIKKKFL